MVQCVGIAADIHKHQIHLDDAVEILGNVRTDARSRQGIEVGIEHIRVLNHSGNMLPFNSSSDISEVGADVLIDNRALALRNDRVGDVFRVQAAILQYYRSFLTRNHFTEIVSSKIVSSGTEGGTNLFSIRYFERVAYLAQSPQFYKEHGVAGLERVFETGHVYRAEPHATSRHLTEYYSLDLEMGFIDGPEDVIQLERELLSAIFDDLNREYGDVLSRFRKAALPSMMSVPIWTFEDCLERLRRTGDRGDAVDDLNPDAERQLCRMAEEETGVPAVFVFGFPLPTRPFYTYPLTETTAAGFDLLFAGLEITTGGQRLHRREDLENSLRSRGIDPKSFESYLRQFDSGMPPHGGLAIGLERLTAQILNLSNVREATLYPRDQNRVTP